MIQRIQSLYLLFTLVSLIILSTGVEVFTTKIVEKEQFELTNYGNVFGIQKNIVLNDNISPENKALLNTVTNLENVSNSQEKIPTYQFPFYVFTSLFSLLTIIVLIGYKNIKRQLKLSQLLFLLLLATFVVSVFFYYDFQTSTIPASKNELATTELGLGFYCIAIAVSFSFLASLGIRRDRKIIKSLDRIR